MNFIIYDIILLVGFAIFISAFLYLKRENLKKEGLLFLYKTSWGIKIINLVGKKYKRTLFFLSYVSITIGYFLMASIIYLFGKIIWIYVAYPSLVREIKIPPIMPLIPYLPQIFKLDFLPPFYFTYWIVILAVIAISHEFAHGIFAAYNKIKIKTTGFGFFPFFLPVFLAAFVELDEEKMQKDTKFSQLAILSAGTFANVLTAIFFFGVMWAFFSLAFVPSGIMFDSYSYDVVGFEEIIAVNGIPLLDSNYKTIIAHLEEGVILNKIKTEQGDFLTTKSFFENQKENEKLILYHDAPAIKNWLGGAIVQINGAKISSLEKLEEELKKYSPGDEIKIITKTEEGEKENMIILEKHPNGGDVAWLGIGFIDSSRSGLMGKIYSFMSSFKKPHVYYEPLFDGWSLFIYNLLWWLILISLSVALVNMLPVGIFDGGRFFYLTILGLTGSEKFAKKSFTFITYFFLFLVFMLMFFWAISFR